MEQKTRKIMDIQEGGRHFTCVFNSKDKYNPYRVYQISYGYTDHGYRERKKQIAKYGDFKSVLCLISSMY